VRRLEPRCDLLQTAGVLSSFCADALFFGSHNEIWLLGRSDLGFCRETTNITMAEKFKGKVKWYSIRKGFGFITPSSENAPTKDDIFFHQTSIVAEGKTKFLVRPEWESCCVRVVSLIFCSVELSTGSTGRFSEVLRFEERGFLQKQKPFHTTNYVAS
jgi:hypothetical protein